MAQDLTGGQESFASFAEHDQSARLLIAEENSNVILS